MNLRYLRDHIFMLIYFCESLLLIILPIKEELLANIFEKVASIPVYIPIIYLDEVDYLLIGIIRIILLCKVNIRK